MPLSLTLINIISKTIIFQLMETNVTLRMIFVFKYKKYQMYVYEYLLSELLSRI